jgi:RNA polymerase sigma factor (sigma-70 family)
MPPASDGEHLLRDLAPQVLGALVRRFGDFAAAEDAVQEALLAAAMQWPREGVPENPRGWLIRVAARRMTDHVRAEIARRRRETAALRQAPSGEPVALSGAHLFESYGWDFAAASVAGAVEHDDTLVLLFMCCHPALTPSSAIALTLRAVGGLTTAEIASAFLVPEATMAQRISRAKQRIRTSGTPFQMPGDAERDERLRAVLHVLYLIFNEGYASTAGPHLQRTDLANEAIRLARAVHRLLPNDREVAGLLALMLLTDARRRARTGPNGELIPLMDQDRTRWDRQAIEEGVALLTATLSKRSIGPYQLQAAVAAVHDEAQRAEDTDWPQILELYGLLERMGDNPMVTLNRAIAVAMVQGPTAALELLARLDADPRTAGGHRLAAVRAHLLEMAGDRDGAIAQFRAAAGRTASVPERNYLTMKAARLAAGTHEEEPRS